MTRLWPLAVLALSLGCAEGAQSLGLQSRLAQDDAELTQAEAAASALSAGWDDVVAAYVRARNEFASARMAYAQATSTSAAAATTFDAARARWLAAATAWRFYEQLVIVAAALDAERLDRGARPAGGVESASCEDKMSTAQYRAKLRAQGVDLAGKDIDHIVPHALGGADNPANYEVISSSLNRSLQDTFDANKCFNIAGAAACAAAVAVSRACGTFSAPLPW